MALQPDHDTNAKPEEPNPLEHLGTPAEMRTVNPITPESEALRAQPTPNAPYEPARERRHGFMGLVDSIAYYWQWTLLSVFGAAQLSREVDPIEQLKRRYGREPRKY